METRFYNNNVKFKNKNLVIINIKDFNESGDRISLENTDNIYQIIGTTIQRKTVVPGGTTSNWFNDITVEGSRSGELSTQNATTNPNIFIYR